MTTVTPLSLHSAIRLGAMLKPQGRGGYSIAASCGLQAAAEAVGIDSVGVTDYAALLRRWPILHTEVDLPEGTFWAGRRARLTWAIYILNDVEDWTREQIADWVETIEAQHAQTDPSADPARVPVPVERV